MARLVKRPTSGHDLTVRGFEPSVSVEPAWDSVSLPVSVPLPCSCSRSARALGLPLPCLCLLALSQIKSKQKKKSRALLIEPAGHPLKHF